MENEISLLKNSILFQDIKDADISSMLKCLSAHKETYQKEAFIFHMGETARGIGMVLNGQVHIVKEDFWGNRSIVAEIPPGFVFAESYACISTAPLEVSVVAANECEILFMDIHKLLTTCASACTFHTQLIQNLITILAQKNLFLTKKMEHLSQKTTREKLLSYLSNESLNYTAHTLTESTPHAKACTFEIPFNRQQLADYLSVDRSAMSNELSKLRKEGILDFHKNSFTLYFPLV